MEPAGKIKFIVLFTGVMLLEGIELDRHRHGHQMKRTDPILESDKIGETVEMNNVQDEV